MRTMVMAVCAVALLVGCGGGSDGAAATTTTVAPTTTVAETTTTLPPDQILKGTFTLSDENVQGAAWDDCYGSGGYDDFGADMNVTVRDGEGNIVGSGHTESMTAADMMSYPDRYKLWKKYPDVVCVVKFSVDVKDAEFYAMTVGSRGDLTYSKKDLEGMGWQVALSLGS